MEEHTSPVEPTFLAKLVPTLLRVDELALRQRTAVRSSARRGSLASMDAVMPKGLYVTAFASQALGIAIDHLKAWQLLVLNGTHPAFAQMTLVRTSIEGAVTSRWLTDATVEPSARVSRGFSATLSDLDERRKFEVAARIPLPKPGPSAMSAAQRIAKVREERDRAGLTDIRQPAIIELARKHGSKDGVTEWLYRLTSAFAHGKEWSLHAMERKVTERAFPNSDVLSGRVEASDQIVFFATQHAVSLLEIAVSEFEEYRRRPRSLRARVFGP